MKTIFRTYQFELQPTQEQKVLLDKHFGCVRFVFNHFLNERKEQYQLDKKSDNYYKQAANLTELKKKDETAFNYPDYGTPYGAVGQKSNPTTKIKGIRHAST